MNCATQLIQRTSSHLALLCLTLLFTCGCRTQLWPGPMRSTVDPLPPGDGSDVQPGLDEVLVVRQSDPVMVRPAGNYAGYPLSPHDKRERLRAGSWVMCGAGGRVEVFWPLEGGSVQMFGNGALIIGDRARDEPAVSFRDLSAARLLLLPNMSIELPSGARLRGDGETLSGPFALDRLRGDVLRLTNQSASLAVVNYRNEQLGIGPGQVCDLPLLAAGSSPEEAAPGAERVEGAGFAATLSGSAVRATEDGDGGVSVRAGSNGSVRSMGLSIQLEAGDEVRFLPLDRNFERAPSASPAAGETAPFEPAPAEPASPESTPADAATDELPPVDPALPTGPPAPAEDTVPAGLNSDD